MTETTVAELTAELVALEDSKIRGVNEPGPVVASAGWALTSNRVVKRPDGLDLVYSWRPSRPRYRPPRAVYSGR